MIKKVMLLTLLFASILNAANLNLNKNTFTPNEQIKVHFTGMTAQHKDWIGIYPSNKNNDWGNVLKWKWTNDITAGNLTFLGLPTGTYEIRAFYNNSFHLEASKQFRVEINNGVTTVTTNKATYPTGETVTASFNKMSGSNKDWMGIYPARSTNAWGNVLQWKWTDSQVQGTKTFQNLPEGDYEVRVFFRNSFKVEARHAFKVANGATINTTVTTNKATYTTGQTVTASFNNMFGHAKDWMGIYPAGSTNAWGNVLQWKWTDSQVQGTKSFQNLPEGDYEVRVFFRNSFVTKARDAFTVNKVGKYSAISKRIDNAINHINNKVTYIVTGDSTRNNHYNKMIEYYGTQLTKANIKVYNNAQGGQRGKNWKDNINIATIEKALAHTEGQGENTILEYSFGINDFQVGTEAQIKQWLKEGLIHYMNSKPKSLVLLVTPVAITNTNCVQTLSKIYKELSIELNLPLVNAVIPTTPLVGNPVYYKDNVHPNAKGSRIIVDYILGQIGSQLLKNKLGL